MASLVLQKNAGSTEPVGLQPDAEIHQSFSTNGRSNNSPLSGAMSPVSMLMVVDLPAPLWPKQSKTRKNKRVRNTGLCGHRRKGWENYRCVHASLCVCMRVCVCAHMCACVYV